MTELATLTIASTAVLGLLVLVGAVLAIVAVERRVHRVAPVVVLDPTPPQHTSRQRPAAA